LVWSEADEIGTWSWGDSKWGYNREKDLPKIKEAWDANNQLGLTFYDTAEIYGEGESEKIIGELLRGSDKDVRDKVYIATKCECDIAWATAFRVGRDR
jgi:aryl-alcohol dehydrogenase-like predicted oxidoreductase